METQTPSLDQLKSCLNKLFQFESQDLDFGVYKILHYKHAKIKSFIDKLLLGTVESPLKTLAEAQVNEAGTRCLIWKGKSTRTCERTAGNLRFPFPLIFFP